MTAVVHLANNLFKIGLVGRERGLARGAALRPAGGARRHRWRPTCWRAVRRSAGARQLRAWRPLREITPVNRDGLIVGFALLELSPALRGAGLPAARWLPLGGLLSGFFGGLSGQPWARCARHS